MEILYVIVVIVDIEVSSWMYIMEYYWVMVIFIYWGIYIWCVINNFINVGDIMSNDFVCSYDG